VQTGRRSRDEIEVALLAFELTERRVALALSVAMAIVAVLCALRGSPWPLPAGTGLAAVGFGAAKQSRRPCDHGRDEGLVSRAVNSF
jgi:hypothetical protein